MSPRQMKRKRVLHRLKQYHPTKHPKGRAFIKRLSILVGGVVLGYFVGKFFEARATGVTISLLASRGMELFGEAGADVFSD